MTLSLVSMAFSDRFDYLLIVIIYIIYRSLSFIEDYIREQVLPHYGNTHTTTTVTSLQTTLYRHEAR